METTEHTKAHRLALADFVDRLDDGQWTSDSLCDGWQVRHVVGHLTLIWNASMPKLLLSMIRHRGYDGANLRLSQELGERPKDTVIADLRAHADNTQRPPGLPHEAMLADVVVHSRDITEPLGLSLECPPERMALVLGFIMGKKGAHFWPKGGIDGLRFEASDLDWSHGSGAVVRGPAIDLAAALQGRKAIVDHLSGDGAATFRSRFV